MLQSSVWCCSSQCIVAAVKREWVSFELQYGTCPDVCCSRQCGVAAASVLLQQLKRVGELQVAVLYVPLWLLQSSVWCCSS